MASKTIEENSQKTQIHDCEPDIVRDRADKVISIQDYINKYISLFSKRDLKRSIASIVDGLKPGQRKIIFCAFKRKMFEQICVRRFMSYLAQEGFYYDFAFHESQKILVSTIIEMAQDPVGSNNINLFNSSIRNCNLGEDHASVICMYIGLNPITRCLFHENDDKLLDYLNDIATRSLIEPNWYIPIIPLVLVNGSEGITEDWSSYVPDYNPRDIIANMKCWLNGEKIVPMDPWYRGFKGTIEKTDKEGEYLVTGKVEEIDDQTFRITELPIGMWNEYYIQFLESITEGAPNVKDPLIESFRQNGGNATVDIEIRMKPDKIALIMQEGLLKKFKLTTTISTSNMHLFDAEGKFKKFDSPEQILEEFFALRLSYYEKRKENILANLRHRIVILENKCRFLSAVFKGDIILKTPCQEGEVVSELKQKGFTPIPRKGKSAESQVAGANDDNSEAQQDDNNKEEGAWGGYEYLMFNPLIFFTLENLDNLLAEKTEKEKELENLKATSTTSLWMADLVELEKKLDEMDRKEAEEEKKRSSQAGKAAKTQNVEPENDNTSMEVENVVDVTKPKGREGSKKTQKDSAADDITSLSSTSLEECLDAYNFKSSSSSEITGATETEEPPLPSAAKKRKVGFGIDMLSSSRMEMMRESRFNKKCDFILGMETEDMSNESETEAMMSSDSESSESESDHDDSGCSKLDSDSNDLDDSDSD